MKTSEIKKEAKTILNTIFKEVIKSEDKEIWKDAITFINTRISISEATTRGSEMFIWRAVKNQITFAFGKKFIAK